MKRISKRLAVLPVALAAALIVVGSVSASSPGLTAKLFDTFKWTEVYDGPYTGEQPPAAQSGQPPAAPSGWAGRAGLQAVELRNRLYIMGGRTPFPFGPPTFGPFNSVLWNDVWESRDLGTTWSKLATPDTGPDMWSQRAYFQAVTKGGAMFVLGGQDFTVRPNIPRVCPPSPEPGAPPPPCPDFVPNSTFFNDVWRSTDGANWKKLEPEGPRWAGRAGHSAIEFKGWIYVLGGGTGDDRAIGGGGRTLFNDVWRSRDGKDWEQVTANAQWAPRAGAAVVEKNGYMYLLGGEDGFLCEPKFDPKTGQPILDPTTGQPVLICPYFNDVWRSRDGANWEEVTPAAQWSPRPGHQCQVLFDTIICFGGFGFPTDRSGEVAAHPVDVWVSRDGKNWEKLKTGPWNATSPANIKYDFDSLVVKGGFLGLTPSIYTFGGDREASFIAPDPKLVDDDVWRFSPHWLKT